MTPASAEEKYHFILFEHFRQFSDFINFWRDSTPFRLQELRDTRISYPEGELDQKALVPRVVMCPEHLMKWDAPARTVIAPESNDMRPTAAPARPGTSGRTVV